MTSKGEFATHHRDGHHVSKVLNAGHPAGTRFVDAALNSGTTGMLGYLSNLRAAGVTLPPDLALLSAKPLAVRHRWVIGLDLLHYAGADPPRFASAVAEIAGWVQALAEADARVDTNLENFCLADGQVVLVDVLPPLIPSLRLEPTNLFEALFTALCFDTSVIHNALVGYAARALLRDAPQAACRAIVSSQALPKIQPAAVSFPALWFQARAALGLQALSGDIPPAAAEAFFALTSVREFRDLPEERRAHRICCAEQAMRNLGVS